MVGRKLSEMTCIRQAYTIIFVIALDWDSSGLGSEDSHHIGYVGIVRRDDSRYEKTFEWITKFKCVGPTNSTYLYPRNSSPDDI